jgi:FkbM family methyltransferase
MAEIPTRLMEMCVDPSSGQHLLGHVPAQIFYSQCGEDLDVYVDFFHKDKDVFQNTGTFIELGAADGVKFSNTKFFDDHMGFNGILIEPVPHMYDALLLTRGAGRYNNWIFRCAVRDSEEDVNFLVANHETAGPYVSGVESTMPDDHKNSWHKDSQCLQTASRRMSTLTDTADLKYVDLFSLDVEGGEYEVLKSVNWDIPIYVFMIELRSEEEQTQNDIDCRNLLLEKGFTFHKRVGMSEIWYDKDYLSKRVV